MAQSWESIFQDPGVAPAVKNAPRASYKNAVLQRINTMSHYSRLRVISSSLSLEPDKKRLRVDLITNDHS